jgi:hypothetical protein
VFVFDMHLQNRLAAIEVWCIYDDLSIKSTGAQQSPVEYLRAIGGSKDDNTNVGFEAVHLHEQRIEGLFALIVDGADVDASLSPNGIKFVNKYDTGRMLLSLFEQITHPGCSYSDEHFNKIASADRKERYFGLTGHGTSQERFPCPRRANQEHSFGDASAKIFVLLRVLEEINNLLQLELCFVATGYVFKFDTGIGIGNETGAALPDRKDGSASWIKSTREEGPNRDHENNRQNPSNQ